VITADGALLHPEDGTPQGGVISPLIANVVLNELDHQWQPYRVKLGVPVRFADDLVVLCPTRERAEAALRLLRQILSGLGLVLSEAKTRLADLRNEQETFNFLGFTHRRMRSRKGSYWCYRWPSQKAVRRAKDEIRARTAPWLFPKPVAAVVEDLNRFLRGWISYFRWGNSAKVFHALERFLDERVARFISRKHSHKGSGYGYWVLIEHRRLGLLTITGRVRNGPVHAAR
jgi:RNA-directed DNA polymerase